MIMVMMMMMMMITMPKALADFIFDQCELGSGREFIDLDDREAVGEEAGQKAVSVGFASRFEAWCKREGRPAVSLDGQLWASALPTAAEFFPAVRVRVVYGGAWVAAGGARGGGGGGGGVAGSSCGGRCFGPEGVHGLPSPSWYAIAAAAPFFHLCMFVPLPLLLLVFVMRVQDLWAVTVAPPTVHGAEPEISLDLFWPNFFTLLQQRASGDLYLLPLVEGVLYEWLAVCIATLVRLLLYYVDVDEKACPPMARYLIRGVRYAYSALFTLHIWLYCSLAMMVCCWVVLAAALDPTRFLAFGTAILTTVSAVAWWTSAMMRAARRFRAWVRNALDRMLVNTN